jgi:sortase A
VQNGRHAVMKIFKNLDRWLLVVGVGLLAFCAAAKLHEVVLSRVAVRQFESLRQPAINSNVGTVAAHPIISRPDFVLWSEQRVRDYEEGLTQHLAPPLAMLRIDSVHVEAPVLEGTDDLTLNRGVGHIKGSARIGENGNVGIAGHRDGFFRGLKDVKIGDRIGLEEPGRTETYIVDHLDIVDPANVSVLRSNSESALTLVTCYPFYYVGSAPKRYIVYAVLAERSEKDLS